MDMVLMRMFGRKWEEVMESWGKLGFEYVYNLYSSRNYVMIRE
jgi:hypothetical protein